MGESVVEATISRIIAPTDSIVQQDQEILELETEKVNQVLYAPKAGKLTLRVQVGDKVKIGQVVGDVEESVQAPSSPPKTPPPKAPIKESAPVVPAAPVKRKKMSSIRKTIGQRLVEAKNQTAMLTTFTEADLSSIQQIRAKEKEEF